MPCDFLLEVQHLEPRSAPRSRKRLVQGCGNLVSQIQALKSSMLQADEFVMSSDSTTISDPCCSCY